MRVMFSEYGLATIYVIVAVFAFFMWDLFLSEQKGYGVVMDAVVASISGTNIDDVTNAKNEIKARGWEYAEKEVFLLRVVIKEYSLLVISLIVVMTFIFLFCTWIGDENGVGTVFNRAVAWCGDETSNMLSKMTYDGEFIEMSSTDIRSTSDKLYVISKNDALDLEGVDVPTFNATNPDNILLLKSSVEGQPDEIMSKQDWINQIGLSTDSGNDIIVLVSEFSPITTNHPLAGSGDFYIRREDGSYRKYKGSSSSSSYKVGTILYSIQDVLDEFGNKVIENGKVKQSYQVAYDEGIIYSQDDINAGILIDGTIAKKYKVTYRTERNKLKAEYNAVFVNKTRKLSTDDKTIEDLFNELYKKEG